MNRKRLFGIISSIFILGSLFIGVYLVGIKTGFFKKASGIPANIVVDFANRTPNPDSCWKNLAQGGESGQRLLSNVTTEVRRLNPRYVRIDHIYDHYNVVSRDGAGQLNFDWSRLDEAVGDIRATGATPFLSMSYMPSVISQDTTVTGIPSNWGDWELVVQKTIEHFSGGASDIYYEVWNEPDLFGGFKLGGDKSYIKLYTHAVTGARRASGVRSFKIGGPVTSGLYENWMKSMLSLASEGVRVDFLSWHNYYYDSDNYASDIEKMKIWMSEYPGLNNIELIVSEMGIDPKNNEAYDGSLSAIHTINSVTALEERVSKCFTFEIIDGEGPQKLWGRWGILTNPKFGAPEPKPRYRSLEFLNRMVGERVQVTGNGSWVKAFARYDGSALRILVSNYAPDKHGEAVPIKVTNLPFTNYNVKQTRFLGPAGAAQPVNGTVPEWSATLGFYPNSAIIIEITPQ